MEYKVSDQFILLYFYHSAFLQSRKHVAQRYIEGINLNFGKKIQPEPLYDMCWTSLFQYFLSLHETWSPPSIFSQRQLNGDRIERYFFSTETPEGNVEGSSERASPSRRVSLLFLRGSLFEQTDSRRSPCYRDGTASSSSSLLLFLPTFPLSFSRSVVSSSTVNGSCRISFIAKQESSGSFFLQPILTPPSFFRFYHPRSPSWKSILPWLFIEKRRSTSCQIWRFISTILAHLSSSLSIFLSFCFSRFSPFLARSKVLGMWTFIVQIRSCHADTHFLRMFAYLSSSFDSEHSFSFVRVHRVGLLRCPPIRQHQGLLTPRVYTLHI